MEDHPGAKDHQDSSCSLTHAEGSSHLICSISSHGSGCRSFGEDEEDLIIKLHALLGDRWSLIAGRLPGRTDIEVKNYWDSCIKGKLINMGIDPENHRLSRKPIQPVEDSGDTDDQFPDIAPDLSMNHQLSQEPVQPVEDSGNIDQVSNVTPDLKLGLNMNMTIPSPSPGDDIKVVHQHVEPKHKQDTESGSSATLLLFK